MKAPLLLLALLPLTTAWLRGGKDDRGSRAAAGEKQGALGDSKGSAEIEALLASMETQASLRTTDSPLATASNPSCFYLTLSSLPSSSPCETLSRSDTSRIEVAAGMAICELRTAGNGEGRVPRECGDWQDGKSKVGGCVEALARSPQHWSSYSGYLREVVSLCSSYRRWEDLETARNLYASIATSLSAFVEEIKAYETARNRRESDDARVRDALLSDLSVLSNQLSTTHTALSSDQVQHSNELSRIRNSLLEMAQLLETTVSDGLTQRIVELGTEVKLQGSQVVADLGRAMNEVGAEHRHQLEVSSLELKHELGVLLHDFQASVGRIVAQLSEVESSSTELIEQTHQSLANTASASHDVVESLSVGLALARDLNRMQTANVELQHAQSSNLTDVLSNLTRAMSAQPSFASLGGSISLGKLWWISTANGFLRGGLGSRGVLFGLLSFFAGLSHPWLAKIIALFALAATLYPAFELLLSLSRRLGRRASPPLEQNGISRSEPSLQSPRHYLSDSRALVASSRIAYESRVRSGASRTRRITRIPSRWSREEV